MVKFPQSKLGYAVDGRIAFVPNRCQDESKVKFKESHTHKKKIRRDHRMGTVKGLRNKMKHFAIELEDLKNFSKNGCVDGAYEVSSDIANSYYGEANKESAFQLVARSFLFPDVANRSALYYAAHSGHEKLVRIYLAMFILSRSLRSRKRIELTTEKTLFGWLQTLGFIDCFDVEEYKTCYLNSLNEKVKFVFNSEMHSLQSLRNIVDKTPWSYMLPKNTTPALVSKSKLKPRLEFDEPLFHCQEEYNLYCVQPYYWDDLDEYHGIEYECNLDDSSPINSDEQFAIPESRKVSSDADTHILTCDPREATEDVLAPDAIVFFLDDEIEGDDTICLDSINAITMTDGDDWSLVSDNCCMSEEEHSFVNVASV